MGQPITVTDGMCFAFPDVCLTPAPPSAPVPIPYPNIAQLADATGTATNVNAGGKPVVTEASSIPRPRATRPAPTAASPAAPTKGECKFTDVLRDREGQRQGHRPPRRQHHPEQPERRRHRAWRAADRAGGRLR